MKWSMEHGAWSLEHGAWKVENGARIWDLGGHWGVGHAKWGLDARQLRVSKQLRRAQGPIGMAVEDGDATGVGLQKLKLHPRARWTNTKWHRPRASKIINTTIQGGERRSTAPTKRNETPNPNRSDPIQSRRCHTMGITLI